MSGSEYQQDFLSLLSLSIYLLVQTCFPAPFLQGKRGFPIKYTALEKNSRIFRSANQKQKCFYPKSSVNSYPFPLLHTSFESPYPPLPPSTLTFHLPCFVSSIFTKIPFPPHFDPDPLISTWIGPASRVPGSILTKIGFTHVTFHIVGYPSTFPFLSLFLPLVQMEPNRRSYDETNTSLESPRPPLDVHQRPTQSFPVFPPPPRLTSILTLIPLFKLEFLSTIVFPTQFYIGVDIRYIPQPIATP